MLIWGLIVFVGLWLLLADVVIAESRFVIDQEIDMDTTLMRQAEQARDRQLFIAFELAQRHWRLAFGDGVGGARLVTLEAGNQVAVKAAIAKARVHFGLDEAASVVSCYEDGRDGSGCTAGCWNAGSRI